MQIDNQDLQETLLSKEQFPHDKLQLKSIFDCYCQRQEKQDGQEDSKDQEKARQLSKLNELGGTKSIIAALKTDQFNGLNSRDVKDLQSRKDRYGENKKKDVQPTSIFTLIIEQFEDEILRLLLIAATVSLAIGIWKEGLTKGWYEGVTIYLAIFIIVSITATNDYMKDKQFRKLNDVRKEHLVLVRRNNHTQSISTFQLVVGDIVELKQGDVVPADCILIEGDDLMADESSITGESEHIKKFAQNGTFDKPGPAKKIPNPFLLNDSLVVLGKGLAVVCAVGVNTQTGEVEEKLFQDDEEGTPLQQKLERVANFIGKVGMYVALATFVAMTINLILSRLLSNKPILDIAVTKGVVNAIIVAITIIVVAVPEGLPLAVTISLAYSVNQMRKENNLVRRLEAAETMGGANEILTDKTGTLTQNKMSVIQVYSEGSIHSSIESVSLNTQELILRSCTLNSNSHLIIDDKTYLEKRVGNQTECALLDFVNKSLINLRRPEQGYESIKSQNKVIKMYPFNSTTKKMTVVVETEHQKRVRISTKGASENILEDCIQVIENGGEVKQLDQQMKSNIKSEVIKRMAQSALRTIAMGYKDMEYADFIILRDRLEEKLDQEQSQEEEEQNHENDDVLDSSEKITLDRDLTLIGIFGIRDIIRPQIKEAVLRCQQAQVTVRMVTGDNQDTAVAIAKEVGILPFDNDSEKYAPSRFRVMTGVDFRKHCGGLRKDEIDGEEKEVISDIHAFREIVKELRVLARSTPMDKYILCLGLKQLGNVVAVTGDGTNDAAALKKADVGFAMGIAGTEVAKEAADIILLDDNFGSLVTSIKWGRNVYDSIRKFLQFQLTANLVAMFMALVGGIFLGDSPMNSIQMLWVNLIMDTFAALALATEPPKPDIIKGKPYPKNDTIVTPIMWRNVLGQSFFQISVLTLFLFRGEYILGTQTKSPDEEWNYQNGLQNTIIFNTFIFMQVFNEINCRKIQASEFNVFASFFNNPMFFLIMIVTVAVQILLVQYGGEAVKCVPLSVEQHVFCTVIGSLSLIVGFFVKFLPLEMFEIFQLNEEPLKTEQERDQAFKSSLRKSRSIYRMSSKNLNASRESRKAKPYNKKLSSRNL